MIYLLHGEKYGLMDGTESWKTTLMYSIVTSSLEGFTDFNNVHTVFVEAILQGEQFHMGYIE